MRSGVGGQRPPSRRFCRARAARLDVAAPRPDPGLSQRLKFTYDGRRHEYHWGGGLHPRDAEEVPRGGTSCSSLLASGEQEAPFTSESGKKGIPGAISGERPRCSLCCLIHFGNFGAFWKRGRKGFAALVPRRCGAPPPSRQGEGEGPPLPTRAPAAARTQALAEFRMWIFAEVFFGPDTALGKDSSTLVLEKTPVRFNLSFA